MKIVKFKDGNYAVRRFSILKLGYEYKDMNGKNDYWWARTGYDARYFSDCLCSDLNKVKAFFWSYRDKGTPID